MIFTSLKIGSSAIRSEKRGIGQQIAGTAPAENRRQVKPESIYMHLDHPITERGQDVVPHHGMVGVDWCLPGPRVVLVVAFVARQRVEDRVVHPTETERRNPVRLPPPCD